MEIGFLIRVRQRLADQLSALIVPILNRLYVCTLAVLMPAVTIFAVVAISIIFSLSAVAASELRFPPLSGQVVDAAQILSADDEAELTRTLQAVEGQSTDQIVVVTVPSLQGRAIETFGIELARHWGIGQLGKDNGVLLIVAPVQRKVRIEVGRGLEGVLPDALAGLIIHRRILPEFKRGDLLAGIKAGVEDIRASLLGEGDEVALRAKRPPNQVSSYLPFIFFAFWLVPFVYFISSLNRDRRVSGRVPGGGVIVPGSFGRAHDSWIGPGGFHRPRGGFGGGFSGGGGGFGGGGASGSW